MQWKSRAPIEATTIITLAGTHKKITEHVRDEGVDVTEYHARLPATPMGTPDEQL